MAPKQSKMIALINYRLRVTLNDSRTLTGQMLAFDRHMNLVLADCEEFRFVKQKKKKGAAGATAAGEEGEELEMKRALGLIILRGETIVSLSVEGPPPAQADDKAPTMAPGGGRGMPAGRGMGIVPPAAVPPTFQQPPPMSGPPPGFMPPPGFPGAPPGFQGGPPPGFPGAPPQFGGPPPGFMPPR